MISAGSHLPVAGPGDSRWPTGSWWGSTPWSDPVQRSLSDLVMTWTTHSTGGAPSDCREADVVIEASALGSGDVLGPLAGRAMGWEGWEQPPSRVVVLVDDAWLGAHGAPDRAGRSGAAVAVARSSALRMTARGTTVNVVSLPAGFPDGRSAVGAPLQGQVGVADLAHVIRFLLQPDNGYITGQVIALTGGDLVWSSLSM